MNPFALLMIPAIMASNAAMALYMDPWHIYSCELNWHPTQMVALWCNALVCGFWLTATPQEQMYHAYPRDAQ